MTILLDNIEINVVINYKNNKNIYFRFKEDGKLYVYCNRFVGESKIKDLIVNNKQAILKMYEKIQENLDAENLSKLIDECDKIQYSKIIELRNNAKKRVYEEYTWKKIIERYENIFLKGKNE